MAVGPALMATSQPPRSPACCWTPGSLKSRGRVVAAAYCPRWATVPAGREKSHTVPRNNPFSICGLMFFGKPGGKPGPVVSIFPLLVTQQGHEPKTAGCALRVIRPVLQEIQLGESVGHERQPGHAIPCHFSGCTVLYPSASEPSRGRLGSPTKPAKISTFQVMLVECTGS